MAENRMQDATDSTDGNARVPGALRRWVPIALAVSLALNLLVAGMFLGVWIKSPEKPAPGATNDARLLRDDARLLRDLGLGPFLSAFPPDSRRRVAQRIRAEVGSLADGRAALVRELKEMLDLMRADPFDPEALARVVEAQKQRLHQRADVGREVVLEAIIQMSPEERRAYADRLERALRRALSGPRR